MVHAVRLLPSTLDLYKVGFSAITISNINIELAVYRLQHLLISSYYLYAHTGYQSLPKRVAYDINHYRDVSHMINLAVIAYE